ncbi:efflux RND transporter periplasmic adaptor subunit [Hymenobacter amundsenii]|nr:efflux RND transporter periplasmic adaptor subunit [Hymenobacter amundsenii]
MLRQTQHDVRPCPRTFGWLPAFGLLLLLAGCKGQAHGPESTAPAQPVATSAAQQYTCPMHPQIIREAPGSCPICNMDLVPKLMSNAAAASVGTRLDNVLAEPNAAVLSTVATVRPVPVGAAGGAGAGAVVADTLSLPGVVAYDPRRSRVVAARFGGRIERLLVRFNYQPVRRGQKLLELYSPELVTAEQEYIFVLENDADNAALVSGARRKLALLGLTEAQLQGLARTRRPTYRVAVFSPYDGYVVEMSAGPGGGGGATEAATAPPAGGMPAAAGSQLSLTEGAYVRTGQALFQVMNTDQVWGLFQPTPAELARLRPGQQLQVAVEGQTKLLSARLDFVEPEYRANESTAAVRVYLPNPRGELRRGQRLTARLVAGAASAAATAPTAAAPSAFWLPRTAVVDLGTRQIAFVQRGATFVPVAVQVGQRTATQVQVLSGLRGDENVAANGQYLIDSEGFIQATSNDATAPDRR